jgi:hypothetical protein
MDFLSDSNPLTRWILGAWLLVSLGGIVWTLVMDRRERRLTNMYGGGI